MTPEESAREHIDAVAAHLAARRETLLQRWREAADADPELTSASVLSRAQFFDHIPEVLDAFERTLRARYREERAEAAEDQREGAAGHGMHRWQQGYRQREAMREWRHLHLCLVDELEAFSVAHPETVTEAMAAARRALAQLCSDGVCESADQYQLLQRSEAAGRVRDLMQALEALETLEARRAESVRRAALDLRGSLDAMENATVALDGQTADDDARARSLATLQHGVASMTALLNDLISLARLEAGHEGRTDEPFDAAVLLGELCMAMQPLAAEHGLALVAEGPATLAVEGDRVKTYRIAQNLIVNALKSTERGGVRVTWERDSTDPGWRWVLSVQDTGPGLQARSSAPLARALKAATDDAQAVGEKAESDGEPSAEAEPAPLLRSQSGRRAEDEPAGEGIGLAIVKRLCELLDASLELHTEAGKGTTFRVLFPRQSPRTAGDSGRDDSGENASGRL
jgi:signal transduction histidine kinase